MTIEAVIFDLDGTLAAFNLDYKALRGAVRECLTRTGVPASLFKANETIFEMMSKAELYFKNNGKPPQNFTEARTQCLAIAEKYELDAAVTTSLLPGAVETLKELQKMSLKLGLCTISSAAAVNYILQRFKIADFFSVVVPRDKVKCVKPDIEQFTLALKTLNVQANQAVIVGDSTVDMESAKELKAVAVGSPTGFSTPKQLMDHGANYLITSLIDLPLLIKKLNKESA
jgi:HAD superfamily hydrolase (TIGR01509 family)